MGRQAAERCHQGGGRRGRPVDRRRPAQRAAALQVLLARRPAGLRQRQHRRGRPVHDDLITVLGLSRRDPALALLHTASQASTPVVFLRRVVVAHRHDRRADGPGDHRLDVLAAKTLPPRRRADQHPVSRVETVARNRRHLLRRRDDDLGVQRSPVDGAVSDHEPADGPDGAGGGTRRAWTRRRQCRERAARRRAPGVGVRRPDAARGDRRAA